MFGDYERDYEPTPPEVTTDFEDVLDVAIVMVMKDGSVVRGLNRAADGRSPVRSTALTVSMKSTGGPPRTISFGPPSVGERLKVARLLYPWRLKAIEFDTQSWTWEVGAGNLVNEPLFRAAEPKPRTDHSRVPIPMWLDIGVGMGEVPRFRPGLEPGHGDDATRILILKAPIADHVGRVVKVAGILSRDGRRAGAQYDSSFWPDMDWSPDQLTATAWLLVGSAAGNRVRPRTGTQVMALTCGTDAPPVRGRIGTVKYNLGPSEPIWVEFPEGTVDAVGKPARAALVTEWAVLPHPDADDEVDPGEAVTDVGEPATEAAEHLADTVRSTAPPLRTEHSPLTSEQTIENFLHD
jgi:hypothetical protein